MQSTTVTRLAGEPDPLVGEVRSQAVSAMSLATA